MPDENDGFPPDPSAPALGLAGEPELDREPWVQVMLGELGAKIRDARKAAGMTQEQLAALLPVGRAEVGHYETGYANPGIVGLLRIAEALSVPAASLLPDTAPKAAQGAAEGRLARVEVKGFRDLGIVRVTESTLAGEPMLRAESTDGAVAEFPASSLHFITWLPDGAQVPLREPAALPARDYYVDEPDDWDERNPF
jgi:transcriptional regulator with XRE-family HTH domain